MKKIIIGFFVLTLLVSTTAFAEIRVVKESNSTKNVDGTCVSEAIAVREGAIADAWNVFSTNVSASLTVRKDNLTNAWKITDAKERKAAVKKVWNESRKNKKEASLEYKKSKKEIWSTFKASVKKCGSGVGVEASGESEVGEKIEI